MAAEKVIKLGLYCDPNCLYSIADGDLLKTPKLGGAPAERLPLPPFLREAGWIYFIDQDGDVARMRSPSARSPTVLSTVAEKVQRVGLQREPGYLYFVRDAAVMRMKVGRDQPTEYVVKIDASIDPSFAYFIDRDGD